MEAESLLRGFLAPYRTQSHTQLQQLLRAPVATQLTGPSGKRYEVMAQAAWVEAPGGPLRVVGGIDDGGWQRFNPMIESFISNPPETGA